MNKKKVVCLGLLLVAMLLCISACGTKKHRKQTTEVTTENKAGFIPNEEEDGPVDNEMRDADGNVYEAAPQK